MTTKIKTVIVTGGAKGIGRAICQEFSRAGYNVVCNYLSSESIALSLVSKLCEGGANAIAVCADVSKPKEVEMLFEKAIAKFGAVDVVVCNAARSYEKFILDNNDFEIDCVIDTNLKGVIYCNREAVRNMMANGGKIINISSVWGVCGASCEAVYSASKAGVCGFTKALAKEVGGANITVNCIAPGVIETDMIKQFSSQEKAQLVQNTPLGRIGQPQDVANAAVFFASEGASFITGQVLGVGGGFGE